MGTSIVKAIFRGRDRSEGYKKNQEYTLKVTQGIRSFVLIERVDFDGYCEYQSINAFLINWDCIRFKKNT